MTNLQDLSFEAAYAELEALIIQLESGELSLDDSVNLYERGRLLSEYCQTLLDNAELRISKLSADGQIKPLD